MDWLSYESCASYVLHKYSPIIFYCLFLTKAWHFYSLIFHIQKHKNGFWASCPQQVRESAWLRRLGMRHLLCDATFSHALVSFSYLSQDDHGLLACFLPSFLSSSLSFPLKERVHSVTAKIDLEMRRQQRTFQKVLCRCRPKNKAIFKSMYFNSMLEVMGEI